MNNGYRIVLILAILAGVGMLPVAADDTTVGGDQGWYAIYCNVYGAKIYLDDKYIGTTPQAGALSVPVSTTGTPYTTIRVQKYGYS
ncbi:MAG: hypothetical protein PHT99_02770, partial [Methanoregula sp.]|nr:hypothetical protein [Methanoregula sp.]